MGISNCNCTMYDFESNYVDIEIKTRHMGTGRRTFLLIRSCIICFIDII